MQVLVCSALSTTVATVLLAHHAADAVRHQRADPPSPVLLDDVATGSTRGPWGRAYEVSCPSSSRVIVVWARGEDGLPDTDDDPRSDR